MYICRLHMKEEILDKATNMFLNLGFKSVTMDDLAFEMGISKKTIYTHFNNKTRLVKETTERLFDVISSGIDHIRSFEKNPIEELYEIKKFTRMHLKDNKSSPQYQLQKYYPKIYSTLRNKQFDVMQTCIIRNIEIGIEQGIYRENLNVDFVSRIYFSGALSINDKELFPNDTFTAQVLEADYLEYHLRGIVTPKGRKILNTIINSNHE